MNTRVERVHFTERATATPSLTQQSAQRYGIIAAVRAIAEGDRHVDHYST